MATRRYVALLRGINVGGKNLVPMADLREALENDGHDNVSTYIQSGNVLFDSDAPAKSLEDRIERALEKRFGAPIVVVVRSEAQLRKVVTAAPKGFGRQPDRFHSDVVFLKPPLTATNAMKAAQPRDGVDQVWRGAGVLYFARLSERLSQSRLNKIATTPEYKLMTIRNWNTVSKLLALLDARR